MITFSCIGSNFKMYLPLVQLDQLDKIFKVLGTEIHLFAFWCLARYYIYFMIYRDLLTLGHPTQEKWPTLVNLPHWQQDVQHIQGHK